MFKSIQFAKNAIFTFPKQTVLIPVGQKRLAVCYASTKADDKITNTRIDDNLVLHTTSSSQPGTPLVLLYSWLAAKQRHLDRFSKLYLNKGCDVVSVQIKPLQLIQPASGSQKIAEKLVDFVQGSEQNQRPLLVHTFSVGAYLHSETLSKMSEHDTKNKTVIVDRIKGQVFDSAVDLDKVPYGTSRALFNNRVAQNTVEAMLNGFFRMTHKHTMLHYQNAQKVFYSNPASTPLLFFYSKVDPVAPASTIDSCINTLKHDHGKEVYSKVFDSSSHVSHMYKYQSEYIGALESFLHRLGCFNADQTTSS
ncbi:transmembrane protein 53-A-like [Antedon mediterranea]|uniref:transmembrane protein 53-A-like n=1 Tax=Antedon mediterranea TaxID=105859 RepID=UPI003AF5A303